MTKVRNTKVIDRRLKRLAKEFKSDNRELQKIAKVVQNELRISLREGEKPSGDKLATLSTKGKNPWSKRRKRLAEFNKTSKFFKPNSSNSNATFTGDLVRKIFAIVKGDKIILFGKGRHKGYKGVNGKKIKGSKSLISDIISGFSDRGDIILGVTESAKERIIKQFRRFVRRKR